MKYFELTSEEKRILRDFEKGEFVAVKDESKAKGLYRKYARNTLAKSRNINIRLSERVLAKLKAKAAQKGIPYQTFASSILHQFVAR